MNTAESQSITAHLRSDALDLSRDIMIDEATHSPGTNAAILRTTLRLAKLALTVTGDNPCRPC